ncbi:MAG TPA: ATP-dependent 6-phosphofructokinase, partial [Syntrophobacteraceae bacterium]|nr:ATP-dependent 6-phosphofructokinase [Syntrophobacteraceae bacterium]
MESCNVDFQAANLGECRIPSPLVGLHFVDDDERVFYFSNPKDAKACLEAGEEPPSFEVAGPRRMIYFDPSKLKAGIVTCGGLCPGLNDAIRA